MSATASALLAALAAAADPAAPAALPAVQPTAPAAAPVLVSPDAWRACLTADPCCQPCCPEPCGPAGTVWASGEFLYWATRGNPLPPLVTTSPAGTPVTAAGVLGTPGAAVIGGNERVNNDLRPGFRVTAGLWLDCEHTRGIEGSYFSLGNPGRGDSRFGSAGSPILSRPFFNAATGQPDAELVAFPGVLAGGVAVDSATDFQGGTATVRRNLCCDCDSRIDLVYGYQHLRLDDELTVTEALTASDPMGAVPFGTRIVVVDRFRTENTFHGGLVGLAGEWRRGRAYLAARGSVALGVSHQVVTIDGATAVAVPGAAGTIRPGGLLAQPTNVGRYENDEFAWAPSVGLRAGYQVTDRVRAFAGYDFLYFSRVARAGDQIDLVVNPTQIPPGTLTGPARPLPFARTTDFWAQGVSAGLELRY